MVLHEAAAYADYLVQAGVPPSSILKECSSYDTVGNGYFSLTIHALPAQWRRLTVITSAFHMPRSRAIFSKMYALGSSARGSPFHLDFADASDDGLFDPEVYQVRVLKEAAATAAWERDTNRMTSLSEMHAWLHATHLCYAVSRQHEHLASDNPKLAATY